MEIKYCRCNAEVKILSQKCRPYLDQVDDTASVCVRYVIHDEIRVRNIVHMTKSNTKEVGVATLRRSNLYNP